MEQNEDPEAFAREVAALLQHRIYPREQAMGIRRVMSSNLAKSLGTGELRHPLSLVDQGTKVAHPDQQSHLSTAQKHYLQEVRKNLDLRNKHAELQSQHKQNQATTLASALQPTEGGHNGEDDASAEARLLGLHIQVAAMERKLERLRVTDGYLTALDRQPAASADFLEPDEIFSTRTASQLPALPKALVQGFTVDTESSDNELRLAMRRLDKAALRNRLLAERERRKYEAAKEASPGDLADPRGLDPDVQLRCLTAVKDALIGWIETQLSKAGDDDESETSLLDASASDNKDSSNRDQDIARQQLESIQKEYERHVSLRREVLGLVSQTHGLGALDADFSSSHSQDPSPHATKNPASSSCRPAEQQPTAPTEEPRAYAIAPLIARLQDISRAQKALVSERSHVSSALSAQRRSTARQQADLARSSELLRRHPPPESSAWKQHQQRPRTPTGDDDDDEEFGGGGEDWGEGRGRKGGKRGGDGDDVGAAAAAAAKAALDRWTFAADSAKIATLEAVAERAEAGQAAIGEALGAVERARGVVVVGLPPGEKGRQRQKEKEGREEDIGPAEKMRRRRSTLIEGAEGAGTGAGGGGGGGGNKGIWAGLDGNLGLINE